MQSEVNQEENLNTTDFDEHFAKISSYIVDTLHGVPLEMTEDEKEQFRIQVISNQYAERLLSEAEKTETYRGLSKIDILHTVSIPQLARTIPLKGLNLSLEKYRMPDGVIIEVESSSHYLGSFSEKNDSSTLAEFLPTRLLSFTNVWALFVEASKADKILNFFQKSCHKRSVSNVD